MSSIKIVTYTTKTNKKPYKEWLEKLDITTQAIIIARLDRVALGNFGDCSPIKSVKGMSELIFDYGPGYRIYYGKMGFFKVVILMGGEKKSQVRDITKAENYWLDYKESPHE